MTDQPEKAGHIQATTRLLALSASDMAAEIERLREDQSLLREIVVERQEEIERLRAQRDQLLAALQALDEAISNGSDSIVWRVARAAIAAVEDADGHR